jgi:hypothetical protein
MKEVYKSLENYINDENIKDLKIETSFSKGGSLILTTFYEI